MFVDKLRERNLSIYQCSKLTGIPYTTVSEIIHGKTNILKCTTEVVYKLLKILNISMDDFLDDLTEERLDFEIFKSNVCHFLSDNDDMEFIVNVLKKDDINRYWNKKWYIEAFYLLAMLDYISRINDIPLCNKYNDLRTQSLKEPLFPKEVEMLYKFEEYSNIKDECLKKAIPEFMRHNIVESEIRNVF